MKLNSRKQLIQLLILILLLGFSPLNLLSQDVKFGGQFFLRSEIDGRDFNSDSPPNGYSILRTRLNAEKKLNSHNLIFIQIQDARLLGSESTLTSNEKNTDIHQAYIRFQFSDSLPLSLQAGRFEMTYGNNRLLGPANWNPVGRAFDGLKLSFQNEFKLDLFAVTIKENQNAFFIKPVGSFASVSSVRDLGSDLYGMSFSSKNSRIAYELMGYYENDRDTTGQIHQKKNAFTLASNVLLGYSDYSLFIESAVQTGKINDTELLAWMFSFSLQNKNLIHNADLSVGMDFLSGTPTGKSSPNHTFLTNFGDNHRYYGNMDYFPSILPSAGLLDLFLKSNLKFGDELYDLTTDLHVFFTHQKVISGNFIGGEIDTKLNYNLSHSIKLISGFSVFSAGDVMKSLTKKDDFSYWGFIGIQSNF